MKLPVFRGEFYFALKREKVEKADKDDKANQAY